MLNTKRVGPRKRTEIEIEIRSDFARGTVCTGVEIFHVTIYDATAKAAKAADGYWQENITLASKEHLAIFLEGVRICRTAIGTSERDIKIPPLPS